MRLNFALLAQEVELKENGGVDIKDPITNLSAPALPARHERAAVIINFMPGDTEKHKLDIKITGSYEGGDCVRPHSSEVGPAVSEKASIGHVAYIGDISLEREGDYRVEVDVDGERLATIPFSLHLAENGYLEGICEKK
ncbi:MAG: hypothetical protein PHS16_00300 [Candidatus Colwellbacteria bacterium]|jgi:hypothetical protein|nr:hypothetical protein [Candidatus Colwellbacteria bacterium]MCK9497240.1 hypothetical protein [Candidatus Colwellbacteria bacterium]MDD3752381.1 hypothetical protein [Candidatus Colwellbacteria bacterium]MDD4818654.1 hypothetical protein [Candidatus Colwellbacteria bacterium]